MVARGGGTNHPGFRLNSEPIEPLEEMIMIRLLLTGLFAYTAYRVTMRIIDEVPGDIAPLEMPGDERRRLRPQSAAMGVEPKR